MPTVKEARRRLRDIKGQVAMAVWIRDDVIGKAKEMGYTIADEAAE